MKDGLIGLVSLHGTGVASPALCTAIARHAHKGRRTCNLSRLYEVALRSYVVARRGPDNSWTRRRVTHVVKLILSATSTGDLLRSPTHGTEVVALRWTRGAALAGTGQCQFSRA